MRVSVFQFQSAPYFIQTVPSSLDTMKSWKKDTKGLKKAYTNAMTVVAIPFHERQWDTMFDDSLKEEGMRDIVGACIQPLYPIKTLLILPLTR